MVAALVTVGWSDVLANPYMTGIWAINILYLVDVHIATVGYILTMKPLDSHIRTANPYFMGWVAALVCYPPFILMNGDILTDLDPMDLFRAHVAGGAEDAPDDMNPQAGSPFAIDVNAGWRVKATETIQPNTASDANQQTIRIRRVLASRKAREPRMM